MWRLVNGMTIKKAWAIHEVVFNADVECTQPILGGEVMSSDEPVRLASEVPKAFDGNPQTAWVSPCSPCSEGLAYIGLRFDAAVVVRCVSLRQAEDEDYRPGSVHLERWANQGNGTTAGWSRVTTFRNVMGGQQQLSPFWGRGSTRFVISNSDFSFRGWRISEIRFFRDSNCVERVRGIAFSSDGNAVDALRGIDGDVSSFWHSDCCSTAGENTMRVGDCTGCRESEAWLGIMLPRNDTVKCLQLKQSGVKQPIGGPHFSASVVALNEWDGVAFQTVYKWQNIPPDEWVELSVGRARSAIGASLGCKDNPNWQRCNVTKKGSTSLTGRRLNASNVSNSTNLSGNGSNTSEGNDTNNTESEVIVYNCTYYEKQEMCNETYRQDADCEGITMELACRYSCCLCAADNPAKCQGNEAASDELPPWLLPAAGGGGGGLIVFSLIACCTCWKRRSCHQRRFCKGCCKCLDSTAERCCKRCRRKK
eukprot:TRINITY_DN1554_c4_g1_i3.p1 TRINITY_DN1554_c4_g1~~TRINITY_DN1554_c4_g1_i3.p1  ORF type:complete len:479 (-),score=63.28 TRINITY_DN1554_c4_g1_i3:83-1519(-)